MTADERRPTMKDVAAVAGVSLATVSRVVNGRDDVRRDLQERVRRAIDHLGYRRDLTASTLRRADRASSIIGLVHEDVSNPFFAAVHRGVEDVARRRGVLTISGSSDEDPERERELAEAFAARGVDGLIIAPCGTDQSYLASERARGTRLVFVDRAPRGIEADAVRSDNFAAATAAVAHLIGAGHRRIAFLGDRPDILTAADRLRGYRATLADAGIAHDPALERLGCSSEALAARAAHELLDGPSPPTAFFSAQNLITAGTVRALRALGLARTVALVGLDDLVLGDLLDPGITVVRQDPVALGRHAAELLFARLDGFDGPARTIVLDTELVARGSGEIAPSVVGA
jgi:LacI family transcriptional regulator